MAKPLLVVASLLSLLLARPGQAQSAAAVSLPPEQLPPGWGGGSPSYRSGADEHGGRGGSVAGHLTALTKPPTSFGNLQQAIRADAYRGKRVRLSAYIRTKDVVVTGPSGAGLWLRVDGGGATQSFDNTQQRRINGTKDWTRQQIVLEVPEDALTLSFGFLMDAPGEAWVDDIVLEAVPTSVPVTAPTHPAPAAPTVNPAQQTQVDAQAQAQRTYLASLPATLGNPNFETVR